ncbi:hypothetical protein APR04_004951 [Promicromonospora umidemergens]|nr:hypothetical protein [Promicromonospora umidemergens]
MAAVDVLRAYADWLEAKRSKGFNFQLTCEWHEDWIVHRGGQVEIVSAKHREPQVGAITSYRSLLNDAGVLHLLRNWLCHNKAVTCRLVTTSELGGDARDVGRACHDFNTRGVNDVSIGGHADTLDKFIGAARRLDNGLPLDRLSTAEFLSGLHIDGNKPHRDHVKYMAPSAYAEPVAALLDRPGSGGAIWQAVLSVVRPKMQGDGPTPRAALPTSSNGSLAATVEKRVVSLPEIDLAVSVALERADGYGPPPRVYDSSNLGIKLTVGELSDNVIAHARRLRTRYFRIRDAAFDVPGEQDRFETVELRLLRLVREVERTTGTNSALWHELEQRLESLAGTVEFNELDIDNLTGAIADLCEQCEVWFSDRFDVAAARDRIAAGGRP